MSILPLTEIGALAISFYSVEVEVHDITYVKDEEKGQDIPGSPVIRTIQAAVDPSNKEKLENIFGGSVGDGSIGIFTSDVLYMQDQGGVTQSYVISNGLTYRIKDKADWTEQMGIYVYLGERHVEQVFT